MIILEVIDDPSHTLIIDSRKKTIHQKFQLEHSLPRTFIEIPIILTTNQSQVLTNERWEWKRMIVNDFEGLWMIGNNHVMDNPLDINFLMDWN